MIREGNPRERIRRAVCPWISVLARWVLTHPVAGHDGHADKGRQPGSQYGAEYAHAQRKNKDIVQQDIGHASSQHGKHGKPGISVIPHETDQDIIENKGRGKEQYHFQVGLGHCGHLAVSAQKRCNLRGQEQSGQEEQKGRNSGEKQGVCKNQIRKP